MFLNTRHKPSRRKLDHLQHQNNNLCPRKDTMGHAVFTEQEPGQDLKQQRVNTQQEQDTQDISKENMRATISPKAGNHRNSPNSLTSQTKAN